MRESIMSGITRMFATKACESRRHERKTTKRGVRMRFAIVAAVFGLSAIPTIARAHAGNDDPNVVHACVANGSLAVRIVGVSGSCIASHTSKAETPAHWAIQGPPGANGTNGTNGTNGIDGTSVTVLGTFSGDQNGCPNGGTILGTATGSAYVCNGQDAAGATNPDPPCFDNTNRYVDCGNGTVTDTVTGLIWLKDWNCLPNNNWTDASQAVAGLKNGDCNLTDHSSAGDWRLPTRDEWSATIARAAALSCTGAAAPSLTNDAGLACSTFGPSLFAGVPSSPPYWSSTSDGMAPAAAYNAFLFNGVVLNNFKIFIYRVWPVRGRPR